MICPGCGKPVDPVAAFCSNCGAKVAGPPAPPVPRGPGKGPSKGFFSSPAGIALVVVVGVIIIGLVVALVVVLAVKGDGYEKQVTGFWNDFRGAVAEIDTDIPAVENLSAVQLGDTLNDFLDEARDNRDEVSDILEEMQQTTTPGDWENASENLAQALGAYNSYLKELEGFLKAYVRDPADTSLDAMLERMKEYAKSVKGNAEKFTEAVASTGSESFDPAVLELADSYESKLARIREQQGQKPQAGDDTAGALAGARATVNAILPLYKTGGYSAITGYMTPSLLQSYNSADPPWDQVSYTFTNLSVADYTVKDANTIVFTIKEDVDDMGTAATVYERFEMVNTGGRWLLNERESVQ